MHSALRAHRAALLLCVFGSISGSPALAASFTVTAGTTDTTAKTVSGTDTGIIEATGILRQTGSTVPLSWNNTSTGVVITNSGTIENTGSGRAIDHSGAINQRVLTLTNNASGIIRTSANDAFRVNSAINNGSLTIDNSGLIQAGGTGLAALGQALDFRGQSAATGFTSTIINRSTGILEALTDDAVRPGRNATISNFGIIRSFGANTSGGANGTADGIDTGGNIGITITNQTGGLISGARHGITVDTDVTVINLAGGTILGRNGSGIGSDGNGTVTNSGTITGSYAGVGNIFNSDGTAKINGDGDGVDVDNIGTIINTSTGRIEGAGAGGFDSGGRANNAEGLALGGGTVDNTGVITGTRAILVNKDTNVDRSGVAAAVITNNAGGSIIGTGGFAIRLENKTGTAIDNDTIINRGTITGAGSIPVASDIVLMESTAVDTNSTGTLDGVVYTGTGLARFIRGDGSAIQMGEGNDTLTNSGTITGSNGLAINLEGGTDTLNLQSGTITGTINGGTGSDTVNLTGAGTLASIINFETLNAGGTWTLTGTQAYTNAAITGTLSVNGTLNAATTVAAGGKLMGTGTVSALTLSGIVAPGNSIGTLNVGTITLATGAQYQVETNATTADRITATGAATIQTGVTVAVTPGIANYAATTNYTILSSSALTGTFASVTSSLPYLVPTLSYSATSVTLTLTRNATFLSQHAATPNQLAVAAALDASNTDSALFLASVPFTGLGARQVFDSLSGEIHASLYGSLLSVTDQVRNTVMDRLVQRAPQSAPALWIYGNGNWRSTDANGNAAKTGSDQYGIGAGIDAALNDVFSVGLTAGYQSSHTATPLRGSTAETKGFDITLYGEYAQDLWRARGGVGFGHADIDTRRDIIDPTAQTLLGRYTAKSWFGFAEFSYLAEMEGISVEPLFAIDTASIRAGAISETGGNAALNASAQHNDFTNMLLGARFGTELQNGDILIQPRLMLGWRHALGSVNSRLVATFQNTGTQFTVMGAPIAEDALAVDLGVGLMLAPGARFGLSYRGQFSTDTTDQGVNASLAVNF